MARRLNMYVSRNSPHVNNIHTNGRDTYIQWPRLFDVTALAYYRDDNWQVATMKVKKQKKTNRTLACHIRVAQKDFIRQKFRAWRGGVEFSLERDNGKS